MPLLSAADSVSPAIHRAKSMLLPFRFRKWLKMGFIGWLAGELTSGSFNFQFPGMPGPISTPTSTQTTPHVSIPIAQIVMIAAVVVGFLIVLSFFFLYLFSRFRFILFDCVLSREIVIERGWRAYRAQAGRYFGFWVILALLSLACIAAIVGIPLWHAWRQGLFQHAEENIQSWFVLVGSMFLALFVFGLAIFVLTTLAKDFLVPLMALDDLRVGEAWKVLRTMIKAQPGAFLAYIGLKFVLYIAALLLLSIGIFIVILVLAIPAVIIGIILVAAIKSAAGSAVVLLTCIGIMGMLAAGVLVTLTVLIFAAPLSTFFASYTLYFFAGRYPKLGALIWPPPPMPQVEPVG